MRFDFKRKTTANMPKLLTCTTADRQKDIQASHIHIFKTPRTKQYTFVSKYIFASSEHRYAYLLKELLRNNFKSRISLVCSETQRKKEPCSEIDFIERRENIYSRTSLFGLNYRAWVSTRMRLSGRVVFVVVKDAVKRGQIEKRKEGIT